MRIAIATGVVLISAVWASAQTSAPQDAAAPAKTVTITGCVAGSAGAGPFTLTNAATVPDSAKDSTDPDVPSPVPSSASATPTQPPGSGSTTAGATGTAGSATPAPAGTSGAIAKESSATYRLTGTDLTPWSGKRVQMVGIVAPAKAAASANAAADTPVMPEFRVQSVQSVPGTCPKP